MLVESPDGQRALLGRSRKFVPGLYTCLSGFIDQCESIEEVRGGALRGEREVARGDGLATVRGIKGGGRSEFLGAGVRQVRPFGPVPRGVSGRSGTLTTGAHRWALSLTQAGACSGAGAAGACRRCGARCGRRRAWWWPTCTSSGRSPGPSAGASVPPRSRPPCASLSSPAPLPVVFSALHLAAPGRCRAPNTTRLLPFLSFNRYGSCELMLGCMAKAMSYEIMVNTGEVSASPKRGLLFCRGY